MTTVDLNKRVVEAARGWLDTPYAFGERERGVGVDCANLFAGVGEDVGLFPRGTIPIYDTPEEFWLSEPDYIETRMDDAAGDYMYGSTLEKLVLPTNRSFWWLDGTLWPGDLLLLTSRDAPTLVTHAAILDSVQHQLLKIIHAWNPSGGSGSVRFGIIGHYYIPYIRYRVLES